MLNNKMQMSGWFCKPKPVKDRACNCQILLKQEGLGEKMKDGMKRR
jgi:hypothetical protein